MKQYNNPPRASWTRLCKRPALEQTGINQTIQSVFDVVKANGDKALTELTKQFDEVKLVELALSQQALEALAEQTTSKVRGAVDVAYNNIEAFHLAQKLDIKKETVETMTGVLSWRESRPIERVGLYVPGGSAPLISTVLMLGVPAQIAGCKEIVLCTPPRKDGTVEPAICYAALKVGATKLVTVGGVQAIAALAIGTDSVPKVDKIFGPGNQYVTAAKQFALKYGVAIDMPAGPSEVMVVADDSANPAFVAADLLSQAEHGTDSQVVLVTTEKKFAAAVNAKLYTQLESLPRKQIAAGALKNSFCVVFDGLDKAMQFVNSYAPEHLILSVKQPGKWAAKVWSAGSVFLGNYSPESAGDYASGTNHTLPTNGWARSYGGVSLESFVKKVTFQSLSKSGLKGLASTIETLAEAEGLEAHKLAVTIRLRAKSKEKAELNFKEKS